MQSVREVTYPDAEKLEVPDLATGAADSGLATGNADLVIPMIPEAFTSQLVGTELELTLSLSQATASLHPRLRRLIGFDSYGRDESEVRHPLIAAVELPARSFALADASADAAARTQLLAMQMPLGEITPKSRNRRVLVFLTTRVPRPLDP